jgi:predicted Zn-dependent protease
VAPSERKAAVITSSVPRREWTAYYYDGRTANRETVTVTVGAGGLDVHRADGSSVQWPFAGVRQTQGAFGKEQLRLEFGVDPVEALLVEGDGLPEAIRAVAPRAMQRVRPRQSTAKVVGVSLAALVVGVVTYAWGAPIMTDWLTPKVPVTWEVGLGQSVVRELAPSRRQCGDSAAHADLRRVVDRLLTGAPSSPYTFRIAVVRDTMVNAFAAPGGFIVLHSGLISSAETPEQLAGVLAHEVQHVLRRHSTRAVIREAPLRLALATVSGGGIETAATVVGTIGVLSYRRADEAEADREGMRMLEAANVDPAGMVAFMRTLDKGDEAAPRMVRYLSSHPHTKDRVAMLEATISRAGAESRPVLDSAAWRRVRTMCGGGSEAIPPR